MEWHQLPDSPFCYCCPFCRENPDLSATGMAQKEKVLMKEEKLGYLWQLEYAPGMSKYEENKSLSWDKVLRRRRGFHEFESPGRIFLTDYRGIN